MRLRLREALRCCNTDLEVLGHVRDLLSAFLSSSSDMRTDKYRGNLANHMRSLLEVARRVRDAMGPGMPVFSRASAAYSLGQSRPDEEG